uniref:Uncharacterized protein n=1 Tax=Caenorhabditis japonica TaxID=281687 RepID=A0A8R1DX89_CAEJA
MFLFLFLLFLCPQNGQVAAQDCSSVKLADTDVLDTVQIYSNEYALEDDHVAFEISRSAPSNSFDQISDSVRMLGNATSCPATCTVTLNRYTDSFQANESTVLYFDTEHAFYLPAHYVKDQKTVLVCAKSAGNCGATVPVYRYYRISNGGVYHAYSFDQQATYDGYNQEFLPICYAWNLTTGSASSRPTCGNLHFDTPLSALTDLKIFDNQRDGIERDHYYTTLAATDRSLSGYNQTGVIGKVVTSSKSTACSCLTKLQQQFDNQTGYFHRLDHKLIVTGAESNRFYEEYVDTGEIMYCAKRPGDCGATLPLWKQFQFYDIDTVYSTDSSPIAMTYLYPQTPLCYIWPANYSPNVSNIPAGPATVTVPLGSTVAPTGVTVSTTKLSDVGGITPILISPSGTSGSSAGTTPSYSGVSGSTPSYSGATMQTVNNSGATVSTPIFSGVAGSTASNSGASGITGSIFGSAGTTPSSPGATGLTSNSSGATGSTGNIFGSAGTTPSSSGVPGLSASVWGTARTTPSSSGASAASSSGVPELTSSSSGVTGSSGGIFGSAGTTHSPSGIPGATPSSSGANGLTSNSSGASGTTANIFGSAGTTPSSSGVFVTPFPSTGISGGIFVPAGTTPSSSGVTGSSGGVFGSAGTIPSSSGTPGITPSSPGASGSSGGLLGSAGTTPSSSGVFVTPFPSTGVSGGIFVPAGTTPSSSAVSGPSGGILSQSVTTPNSSGASGSSGGIFGSAGTTHSPSGIPGATPSSSGATGLTSNSSVASGATPSSSGASGSSASVWGTAGTTPSSSGVFVTPFPSTGVSGGIFVPAGTTPSSSGAPGSSSGISGPSGTTPSSSGVSGPSGGILGSAGTTASSSGVAGGNLGPAGTTPSFSGAPGLSTTSPGASVSSGGILGPAGTTPSFSGVSGASLPTSSKPPQAFTLSDLWYQNSTITALGATPTPPPPMATITGPLFGSLTTPSVTPASTASSPVIQHGVPASSMVGGPLYEQSYSPVMLLASETSVTVIPDVATTTEEPGILWKAGDWISSTWHSVFGGSDAATSTIAPPEPTTTTTPRPLGGLVGSLINSTGNFFNDTKNFLGETTGSLANGAIVNDTKNWLDSTWNSDGMCMSPTIGQMQKNQSERIRGYIFNHRV